MNFFEQQDRAHQNTLYLLGLFVLALLGMVLAIYLVVVLAIFNTIVLQPGILAVILASVIGLVGAGSLYKFLALRAGGQVVARDLGGRLVQQETQNPKEAQLLNVVEEMAIASGVAVPMVYLLDREPGINAFAAGFTPHDAVIGITQGCLEQLDRDELQGVIAHEFSHILNGDMRLNLRLIAVLQGILIVHIVGRVICRGSYYAGGGRSSRSDREGGIAATFMVVGFALLVIGFIGLVCGRLIKSAISRQREFLADASAVQFTRNPAGLSGALRRIGGFQTGSAIAAPAAEEASHLFFGEAITGDVAFLSNFNWFGTHPPLKERIQRLENGVGTGIPLAAAGREQPRGATTPAGAMGLAGSHSSETASAKTQAKANQFVTTIGTVNAQNLQAVQQFLGRLPEPLRSATREAQGAIALIFTLLLDEATDVCNRQLTLLGQTCAPAVIQRVQQFQPLLQNLPATSRLPLVDLTIPALRSLSRPSLQQFLKQVQALVAADGRVTLSEYTLQAVLHRRLRPVLLDSQEPKVKYQQTQQVLGDCIFVLSALAQVGDASPQARVHAFRSGLFRLPGASKLTLPKTPPPCKLSQLGKSLRNLELATPKLKQAIVAACAHTVLEDQQVTLREAELLRAVVIALDCPIPPFLDAATVGRSG